MKKINLKNILTLFAVVLSNGLMAASPMEEYFYSSGKIRVVVAVAAVIMIGIFVYLFMMDRRLKKLENNK